MTETITIASRFCGPPTTGNGGYVAGIAAAGIEGPAEVTLRVPPPLDRELQRVSGGDGVTRIMDGEVLVAEARAADLDLTPPPPPDMEAVLEAATHYRGFHDHPFETCFVCGPARDPEDALCIFSGPVAGTDLVAAPWVPNASLDRGDGSVADPFIWAALDCPGYFSVTEKAEPALLGRFTAQVLGTIPVGERCISVGWPIRRDGRKNHAGTAVYRADGTLVAQAQAIWITLRK